MITTVIDWVRGHVRRQYHEEDDPVVRQMRAVSNQSRAIETAAHANANAIRKAREQRDRGADMLMMLSDMDDVDEGVTP